MFGSIIGGLLGGLFKALFGWFTDRQTRADQVELGQRRQEAATRAADQTVIRKADDAAKKAAQEPIDVLDPNDLDARR